MNVVYANGTGQQQQWVRDAIEIVDYPFNVLSASVTFVWDDPGKYAPNHAAFACTVVVSPGVFAIHIRPDLDAPNRDAVYTGKNFYLETVIHELGHVIQETIADASADHDDFCNMFGAPTADWATSEATPGAWELAVKESVAETFKDLALDGRVFDNRTRWRLPEDALTAFLAKMLPKPGTNLIDRPYNGAVYGGHSHFNPYTIV